MRAWLEHIWTRMRRLDYWNPAHIPTNAPARMYRFNGPGSQPLPTIPRKGDENIYSIRYFHRDYKRRDVGYYEDTPLSLNHNLMKGKPTRPDDDPSGTLPQVNNGFAIGRAPPAENSHAWGRMPKQLGSFFTKYDTPDPRAQ